MSSKQRVRKWTRRLGPDDDINISRTTLHGRLVGFVLNQCMKTPSGGKEVIRYDTHHGRLHVHRFWRQGQSQIEYIEKRDGEITDYEPHFQAAKREIQDHWRRFRRLMAEAYGEETRRS